MIDTLGHIIGCGLFGLLAIEVLKSPIQNHVRKYINNKYVRRLNNL